MEKQAVSMVNDSSIICMTSFSLCPTIVRHAPNNCQPHVHQLSAAWPTVVVHCQSRNCQVPTNEFGSVSIFLVGMLFLIPFPFSLELCSLALARKERVGEVSCSGKRPMVERSSAQSMPKSYITKLCSRIGDSDQSANASPEKPLFKMLFLLFYSFTLVRFLNCEGIWKLINVNTFFITFC